MEASLRCCVCPNQDVEIDIVDSGPTSISFEGEEEQFFEDEPLDCKKIQLDLLCMRSVIDKYQIKLKGFLEVCPEDPCTDYQTELSCSKNDEICQLQRSQYKLQCQIKELVGCCKMAKHELRNLRSLMCEKSEQISALQKHAAALESWRRTLELEAGLCIERFEFLKNVKAEWSDVVKMLQKDKDCFKQMEKQLVPKKCYIRDKKYFANEIGKLKQMFRELYELQHTERAFGDGGANSPPSGNIQKLAEKEYMALKKKFNEMQYGKNDDKNFCD